MHPILIKLGPITLYTYGLFLAIAFILGIYIAEKRAKEFGFEKRLILNTAFIIFIFGLIGARLILVLSNISAYSREPLDILIGRSGFTLHGGILFAIIASLIYLKRKNISFLKVADCLTPSIAIGISIGRIGCLFEGCCHGKPTSLPWGIVFPKKNYSFLEFGNIPIHPTQIYESLACLILFFILLKIKPKKDGDIFFLFFIIYSVVRFFIEFYRDQPIFFLGLTQPQIFFIFLASVILIIR
ncbi:TPA: prolipoprotein diacylglyceryl transferase [bacterium]|nr:prolipoprotein diacylglyceryl transferase [bacterium]